MPTTDNQPPLPIPNTNPANTTDAATSTVSSKVAANEVVTELKTHKISLLVGMGGIVVSNMILFLWGIPGLALGLLAAGYLMFTHKKNQEKLNYLSTKYGLS